MSSASERDEKPFPMNPIDNNDDLLVNTVRASMGVVARNAHLVLKRDVPFATLGKVLLEVAESLAMINKTRLRHCHDVMATVEVPQLNETLAKDVRAVVKFGIEVAHEMIRSLPRPTTNSWERKFDVFLSHAGEEKFLYVPLLRRKLTERTDGLVFLDSEALQAGRTSDAKYEIFKTVLSAKVVLAVASFDAVQKEWPMAELLCGFALNETAHALKSPSPLVVDAMARSSQGKRFREWWKQLQRLVPVDNMATFVECASHTEGKWLHY